MADAEVHRTFQEQLGEEYPYAELLPEQTDSFPSATELHSPEAERIFNLTGTTKLSSEHIAKLQGSASQDQIGAWTPSNTSSSQSLHVRAWRTSLSQLPQMPRQCLQGQCLTEVVLSIIANTCCPCKSMQLLLKTPAVLAKVCSCCSELLLSSLKGSCAVAGQICAAAWGLGAL